MDTLLQNFSVKFVNAEVIRPLRNVVLRPGLPYETTAFEGDHEDTTFHIAVYDSNQEVVGAGSLLKRQWNDVQDRPAYQLRGMATAESVRGKGVGKVVLSGLEEKARSLGGALIWCNARESAVGFYRSAGWEICSEEFDIPNIGPHFSMLKYLG